MTSKSTPKNKTNRKEMQMKQLTTNPINLCNLAGILLILGLSSPAVAGPKPNPGQSSAFGQTLAQWQDTYFRRFVGQLNIPPDANGNAVVDGVVLMPLPNAPGDGTPAALSVTLNSGQPFTMPMLYLLGTSYTDGTPPDPLVDVSFFKALSLTLRIDGVTVIDSSNMMNYFSQFAFAPPIPIDSPPIDSVVWGEVLAFVHSPFSVGTHTMKVDLTTGQPLPPNFGGGTLEFHNTWNITVSP
jgi:hypothetical protein